MEELKNNETSEKKETIEPLEVITLELRRMNGVFLLQRLRWWLLSM